MTQAAGIVLAIDAAIGGGSLSIVKESREVANWIGSKSAAKAEEILANIDSILITSQHTANEIRLVAVSAGPGSFTGIRVGFSTALGLSTGLSVRMASESTLKAMAAQYSGHHQLLTAVPAGREMVCRQLFDTSRSILHLDEPCTIHEASFLADLQTDLGFTCVLHRDLFVKTDRNQNLIDFGGNVAFAIAQICDSAPQPQTGPVFVSKTGV